MRREEAIVATTIVDYIIKRIDAQVQIEIERIWQDALIEHLGFGIVGNRVVERIDDTDVKLDDTDVKLGAEPYRQELKRRLPVTTTAMGL